MKNILEYLELTEQRCCDSLAVDDGKCRLTWRELLGLSRRMGTALAETGNPGEPIVVFAEKSAQVLAAMFGATYAGCFYAVIDPEQPPERIREMIQILSPGRIVTEPSGAALLKKAGVQARLFLLEEIGKTETDTRKLGRIREQSRESDLLYGVFTSGSTGVPKGIVVSHKAVIDFITHFTEIFGITQKDRLGNQAPFDFDISVKDIYSAVMTGAALILIDRKLFSMPPKLLDYLCEKEVTNLTWAVSALTLVSSLKGLSYRVPRQVKRVLFSGEIMPARQLRLWQEALPDAEFVNLYGPSEITCNCTYYPVRGKVEEDRKLPIGRPFPGRIVFLADEAGKQITESNAEGEICVGGESLSEGYYRNPEETQKRFVTLCAYGKRERCYRTGDLGYYGEDGELYFGGRTDFQIKHMGHRIELEEIERCLGRVEGVERSCCVLDEKKNRLVAFCQGEANPSEIRLGLRQLLPSYMIPNRIVKVACMPLNKNGKTDRAYFRAMVTAPVGILDR